MLIHYTREYIYVCIPCTRSRIYTLSYIHMYLYIHTTTDKRAGRFGGAQERNSPGYCPCFCHGCKQRNWSEFNPCFIFDGVRAKKNDVCVVMVYGCFAVCVYVMTAKRKVKSLFNIFRVVVGVRMSECARIHGSVSPPARACVRACLCLS